MTSASLPVVEVRQGRLRGAIDEFGYRFLGVPFAQNPAVAGRFGPPLPHPGWDGIKDALSYGATALQPDRGVTVIPEPIIPGENCLNLNVYTPDLGSARLPVLVWIHGGGFFGGCNASPWYRGSRFARDGVVLVSVNYRLGAEGFAVLDDAPANRGLLDWIAALEWIQENIPAFGGDPARVTIAGQSAGGGACATLLAVPRARDLFRAAICMSGAAQFTLTLEDAAETGRRLAACLGVRPRRAEMEAVPLDRLLAAQAELTPGLHGQDDEDMAQRLRHRGLPWAPVVDGSALPEAPALAIAAGAARGRPVLVGTTAHEFNMAPPGRQRLDWAGANRLLAAMGLSASDIAAMVQRHLGAPPGDLVGQALTDVTFRVPAAELADAVSTSGAPTYAYEFRWPSAAEAFRGLSIHCLDIPFVFDVLDAEGVEAATGPCPPQELATRMHAAWVAFVASGSPGWARYTPPVRATMAFDRSPVLVEDPLALERRIWTGRTA